MNANGGGWMMAALIAVALACATGCNAPDRRASQGHLERHTIPLYRIYAIDQPEMRFIVLVAEEMSREDHCRYRKATLGPKGHERLREMMALDGYTVVVVIPVAMEDL